MSRHFTDLCRTLHFAALGDVRDEARAWLLVIAAN